MQKQEEEKTKLILKTIQPILAINMFLNIQNGYAETLKSTLQAHPELLKLTLLNNKQEVIYETQKEESLARSTRKLIRTVILPVNNSITGKTLGHIQATYTLSKSFKSLLKEYTSFLLSTAMLYILLILFLIFLIQHHLTPLVKLKHAMQNYNFNTHDLIPKMDGNCEVSVINNASREMIKRIHHEVDKRIKLEKNIIRKEHLASMGEMIDNIAHQWRQPLMSVNSILLAIDRENELGNLDKQKLSKKIENASDILVHMSHTLEDFRHLGNPNKPKESFNIFDTIQTALELLKSRLKDINVQFHYPDISPIIIEGYKNEFLQVILIVLNNSIDAFEEKSIKEKSITITLNQSKNKHLKCTFMDNAGGIETKIIEKVFDPYYTTKHQSEGTGLGLYIAKLIIKNSMNGDIELENCKDGLKVVITIK
jgi:signal transduction histidine kinase